MACQVSLDMWPLSSRPIMKPPRLFIEPYQPPSGRSYTSKSYGLNSIGGGQLATAGRGLLKCRPLPPLLSRLTLFVMVIMVVDRYTNQWLIPSDYGAGLAPLAYATQSLLPSTRLTSDNANSIAREEVPIRACPLDNSLDQLHRFWELWREGRTTYLPIPTGLPTPQENEKTTSVNFTYTIQDVSFPAQRQYIITEYFQGEVNTDGGSGFRVDINSTAGLSKCSVVDHFNGNYSVCCPPTPMPQASPCGHTIFSIRLSFTRFFAYQTQGQTLPLLEPIYTEVEQAPCIDTDVHVHALRHSSGPAPAPSVPRCDRPFHLDDMHQGQWRVDPLAPPEAFWTSFNTSSDRMLYKWAVPREIPAPLKQEQTRETNNSSVALQRPAVANMQDLCLYDRLADEEIDACLGMEGKGNVRSLHLIGDSHMRVLARYLAPHHNATFQGPWGQTNTEVSENFKFLWAGLGPEIGPAIVWNTVFKPTPNDRAMGPNDVIVFNNGAWDLWMAGPSNFANQTVPWIVDAARQLRGHPLWAKARVIYMTNYGYPLNNRHPGFRSEFGARAVDQALGPKLQELGVEVFDVLPLTDSRSADVADDHHWIDDEGHGEVGRELAHLLLRAICVL